MWVCTPNPVRTRRSLGVPRTSGRWSGLFVGARGGKDRRFGGMLGFNTSASPPRAGVDGTQGREYSIFDEGEVSPGCAVNCEGSNENSGGFVVSSSQACVVWR